MRRLKNVDADVYVLCTDFDSAAELLPLADDCGFECYAGETENVLRRFVMAARFYGVETIIRATGDNPMVDPDAAMFIMDEHLEHGADFSAYQRLPPGRGVEVVEAEALFEADAKADRYEREHVTPYIYHRPGRFKLHLPLAFHAWRIGPDCTVDTEEQYQELLRNFP